MVCVFKTMIAQRRTRRLVSRLALGTLASAMAVGGLLMAVQLGLWVSGNSWGMDLPFEEAARQ